VAEQHNMLQESSPLRHGFLDSGETGSNWMRLGMAMIAIGVPCMIERMQQRRCHSKGDIEDWNPPADRVE